MAHSREAVFQLWDNKSGDRIEVGPDRDGLDLFEIRQYNGGDRPVSTITVNREQLRELEDMIDDALTMNPEHEA